MKKGLILEGGAMRGIFTCGVIDVFLENNIKFDGAIGVSAGAAFGCNYKSKQIGRAFRYNTNYCQDKRYVSFWSWLTTGDLYNAKFCYETLIYELDPWDRKTFLENPMEFHCVATNVETGKAEYHNCMDGGDEDILWIRASASMPVFSKPVEINGKKYLDGGSTDAIPLQYFEKLGYERNVVIETQPIDYVKRKQKYLGIIQLFLHKYPKLIEALEIRYQIYNAQKQYVKSQEDKGIVYVIRPEEPLNIKSSSRDPKELKRVYELGRKVGFKHLENVKSFLCK